MADRVGTYLSDENVRLNCVNQPPPASKTYALFNTPGTATNRMPQRPQNPANLMMQLARSKGIPYAGLKSQYLDSLSIIPRQEAMVLGGLNRGMPTPAPSLSAVNLADSMAGGGVSLPEKMIRGDDGGAMKFRRLFDSSPAKRQQPTLSRPIRSKPVVVPLFPDAPLKISDLKNMPRQMPMVGATNAEPTAVEKAMMERVANLEANLERIADDKELTRLIKKDDDLRDIDGGYVRGTELDRQDTAGRGSPVDAFGGGSMKPTVY